MDDKLIYVFSICGIFALMISLFGIAITFSGSYSDLTDLPFLSNSDTIINVNGLNKWYKNYIFMLEDYNLSYVANTAIASLTHNRDYYEEIILNGNFTLTACIQPSSYTRIVLNGKITRNNNYGCFMINNLHHLGDSNIEICGGIWNDSYANDYSNQAMMFEFDNVTGLYLHDFKTYNASDDHVLLNGCINTVIENWHGDNANTISGDGIDILVSNNTLISNSIGCNMNKSAFHPSEGSTNTTIINCIAYNNRRGVDIYQSTGTIIENCNIYNNTEFGIGTTSGICKYTVISNNRINGRYGQTPYSGLNGYGINFNAGASDVSYSIITGNDITDCVTSGIKVMASSLANYVNINNNIISGSARGIWCDNTLTYGTISSNTINGFADYGIVLVSGGSYYSIIGNVCNGLGGGGSGIYLVIAYSTITGNIVNNAGIYGIREVSGSIYNLFSDNMAYNNNIIIVGTGSHLTNCYNGSTYISSY